MPYVKQVLRPKLDVYVSNLATLNFSTQELTELLLCLSGSLWFSERNAITVLASNMRENVLPDGSINYVLFKYAKYHIKPSYNSYKNYMGAIYEAIERTIDRKYKNEYREAAEWVRIKLLTPYEENKLIENGDV